MSADPGHPADTTRPVLWVALGTALVLVTYISPIATITSTAAGLVAGPVARAWILSSMSVGLAAALLATGVVGDAVGRRRTFLAGVAAVGLGALGCAVAGDAVLFVGARVVQGVGGAGVLACGLAILADTAAPGPARTRATTAWGAAVGLGLAVGALLSAALDPLGWRAAYAATAVLAVLLLVPSRAGVPESRARVARRVDVPGLVLLAAALGLLVAALTQGRSGLDPAAVALAVLGVAALGGFVLVELRVPEPLVEPVLLRQPRFLGAALGSLTLGLGMIGTASFVPTIAQTGLHTGLWTASLLAICWSSVSVASALLLRRLPWALRGPGPISGLLVALALCQLVGLRLGAGSSAWHLAIMMLLAGVPTGALNALLGSEAVAAVPADRAAMGSGANNTARYLGASIGITLFVIVVTRDGGVGAGELAGWDHAVLIAAVLTVLGAAAVGTTGVVEAVVSRRAPAEDQIAVD